MASRAATSSLRDRRTAVCRRASSRAHLGASETPRADHDHGYAPDGVGSEPWVKTCVLDVALTAPYKVKRLASSARRREGRCLRVVAAWHVKPRLRDLACAGRARSELDHDGQRLLTRHDHKIAFRMRTLDVTTGNVKIDLPDAGEPSAISDDGLLVAEHLTSS